MTTTEIKEAVDAGRKVYWFNESYQVVKSHHDYLIKYLPTGHAIGLTWADGETLNGKPEQFYVK